MADHPTVKTATSTPDYELDAELQFEHPGQYKALFEPTRLQICDLLLERAATITELAETLSKPKGTIGHHVGALEDAGLIRVVRTRKVRAIEAKYYGRVARTFLLGSEYDPGVGVAKDHFLTEAAAAYAAAPADADVGPLSTLRHARIPAERAAEWSVRLQELALEFSAERRSGDITYGLLVAFYATDRPHLPDKS